MGNAFSVVLSGSATVNVTSDTAATAKNMAFAEARRQIITDTLKPYVAPEQFAAILQTATDAELMNLIKTSSIDGEKLSNTAYSANITMTLDENSAKTWLDSNGVQNWLTDNKVQDDKFIAVFTLPDAIANWMQINKIMRTEKIPMTTIQIYENKVTVGVPLKRRADFTISLLENGWNTTDQDGILQVSR